MKKIMTGCAAVLLVLVPAGVLVAHHSLANFDTEKPVTVKGKVVRFEQVNPHSVIFIDAKDASGATQRWAIEGPSAFQLPRIGIAKDFLKVGDVIEVCGFATREGVTSVRTVNTEPISESLKATTPKTRDNKKKCAFLKML